MKVLHGVSAVFDRIINLFAILAASLIIFMMLLITAGVILRQFFSTPILGSTEIAEYCLLFFTFLAAAWLMTRDGHVRIDVLVEMLKPQARDILKTITTIICAAVSIIVFWYGLWYS